MTFWNEWGHDFVNVAKSGAGTEADPICVPLTALTPDPDNARKMSDEARAGLGVSMETFGDLGMVFNDRTGQWVSGHQRYERLLAAGASECVRTGSEGYIEHPKTGERFRVRFVDWDATKQRMANLVANNPHIGGDFTEDAVAQLKELEGEDGFELLELDELEKELADELGGDGESDGNDSSVDLFAVFSKDQIVSESMAYFRAKGFDACCRFPSLHVAMQMINKLAQARGDDVCGTTAMQAANRFHPRRFDVVAGGGKTARDAFNDDTVLGHAVEWSVSTGVAVGEQWPGNLAITHGTQVANNFRPGFAAYLYRKYCPRGGTVLDTSAGWGGRIVGALASGVVEHYVGIDPAIETQAGNQAMLEAFGITGRFRLIVDAAEDVDLDAEGLSGACDFAFTSPPYFSVERYSDDEKQSFKRYETPIKWRDGFLFPLLRQHFAALKPGSYNVINIDNVRVPKFGDVPLLQWTKDAASSAGFDFVSNERSLGLPSSDAGQSDENVSDEPVMVFRKPEVPANG